jgi:hypothetical protein
MGGNRGGEAGASADPSRWKSKFEQAFVFVDPVPVCDIRNSSRALAPEISRRSLGLMLDRPSVYPPMEFEQVSPQPLFNRMGSTDWRTHIRVTAVR